MHRFLILSALGLALCLPAVSRAMTQPDCTEVTEAVEGFLTAYRQRDAGRMVAAMPPQYISAHAARVGLGPGFYRRIVVTFTAAALADGSIESLEIDPARTTCHRTADGIAYGLIPTRSITRKHGERMEMRSATLALRDGGRWWLIQVNDDNQISVLREVWPAFEDVAFEPPHKTLVE